MSLFSSWLPSRRLPESTKSKPRYDLPLFRDSPAEEQPLNSSTAFPPPSILLQPESSPLASPQDFSATSPVLSEMPTPMSTEMTVLQRRERELERRLHELLDMQSDALLAGVHGGSSETQQDDFYDNLSSPSNLTSPVTSPSPSRRRKKAPDLAKTRKAIYSSIRSLAQTKAEHESFTNTDISSANSVVQQLDDWSLKRDGLRREINSIKSQANSAESKTIASLQSRATALQDQITSQEQALLRMRREHARLMDEIADAENKVQSRLTSYVTSLNMLEDEVAKFLTAPPDAPSVPLSPALASSRPSSLSPSPARSPSGSKSPMRGPALLQKGKPVTFLSLPPSRRTLPMARAHYLSATEHLSTHAREVRRERRALEQGAVVWKDCVAKIEIFERRLKRDLASGSPITNKATSPGEDLDAKDELGARPGKGGEDESLKKMQGLLEAMDATIQGLEANLELARKRGWKLLIQCIGAELEAFRQGRQILERAFVAAGGKSTKQAEQTGNLLGFDAGKAEDGQKVDEKPLTFPPLEDEDDIVEDEIPARLLSQSLAKEDKAHKKSNSLSSVARSRGQSWRMHRSVPSRSKLEKAGDDGDDEGEDDGPSPALLIEKE